MHHGVDVGGIFDVTNAAGKVVAGSAEVLQQGFDVGRPGIGPFVYAKDEVPPFLQQETEVGADLTAGAGDEDAHENTSFK